MDKNAALRDLIGKAKKWAGPLKENLEHAHKETSDSAEQLWRKEIPQSRRELSAWLKTKGKAGHVGRRVLHEVSKHIQTRPADLSKLDPEAQRLARESGVRVEEAGPHQHPAIRKARSYLTSRYEPKEMGTMRPYLGLPGHKGRVVVGGRAEEAPDITKHELGHATGKHMFAKSLASRSVGPMAAKALAASGHGRAAKIVQGLSDAGTLAEEGRAWLKGVGPDVKRIAKEKGVISKEMLEKMRDPAIGLGSYAAAARTAQKGLGDVAKKALQAKLEKKGQVPMPAMDPSMQAIDPSMMPVVMVPPEYIEQMQAQFGGDQGYQEPSTLARLAMPAGLVGAGLGTGAAMTQAHKLRPAAKAAKEWAGRHLSAGKDKLMNLFKGGAEGALLYGFADELVKLAKKKKMPHFTEQDRPEGVKKVYRALKRGGKPEEMRKRYGKNWKEVAARIAARQGKKGKQHQGPPYKGPLGG